MSIEQEIKALTAAITGLTSVMKETLEANTETLEDEVEEPKAKSTKTEPKKEVVKEKPTKTKPKDELFDEDEAEEETVSKDKTASEVKALAKEKMADGTDRAVIKKMVEKLGGESITDLDQKNLNKLHSQLEAL